MAVWKNLGIERDVVCCLHVIVSSLYSFFFSPSWSTADNRSLHKGRSANSQGILCLLVTHGQSVIEAPVTTDWPDNSLPFQILFIPGIYCHLLDQELLSFPFLSSPINQILYYLSDIVLEIYTFRSCITFFLSSY